MDVSDYTSKLASARNKYQNAAENLKEEYDTQVKDLRDKNRTQQRDQLDNFKEQKLDLQKQTEETVELKGQRAQETIDRTKKDFVEKLNGAREKFDSDSRETRENFKKRLDQVSTAYRDSAAESEKTQDRRLAEVKKKYEDYRDNVTEETQRDIRKNIQDSREAVKGSKEAFENEKARMQESASRRDAQLVRGDYNNRLTEAREKYRRGSNELREATQNNIAQINDTHKANREKQFESYKEDKQYLEAQNERNQNKYSDKAKTQIADRKKEFSEKVGNIEHRAAKDNKHAREDFAERGRELRDTYARDSREKARIQHTVNQDKDTRQKESQDILKKQFDDGIKNIEKRSFNDLEDARRAFDKEKRGIILKNDLEKKALVQEGTIARNKINTKHQDETALLRNSHEQRLTSAENHHQAVVDNLRKNKATELEDMERNFQELNNTLKVKNEKEQQRLRDDAEQRLRDQEQKFGKDLNSIKRASAEAVNGTNGIVQAKSENNHLKENYETRLNNLRAKMEEANYRGQLDKERLNNAHKNNSKEESLKYRSELHDRDEKSRKFQKTVKNDLKAKSDRDIGRYRKLLTDTEIQSQQKALLNEQNSDSQIRQQRIEFGHTVDALTKQNHQVVTEMQEEFNKEKTDFIEKTKRERNHERISLKDHYQKINDVKEERLNKRVENTIRDKDVLAEQYEGKLEQMRKKTNKELRDRTIFDEERRAEDRRELARALESADKEKKTALKNQKMEFDTTLSKTKHSNDLKMNQMVERYELALERQGADLRRESKIKLKEAQANYDRLYENSKVERDSLVQQYEMRLEQLRQANRQEIEKNAQARRINTERSRYKADNKDA